MLNIKDNLNYVLNGPIYCRTAYDEPYTFNINEMYYNTALHILLRYQREEQYLFQIEKERFFDKLLLKWIDILKLNDEIKLNDIETKLKELDNKRFVYINNKRLKKLFNKDQKIIKYNRRLEKHNNRIKKLSGIDCPVCFEDIETYLINVTNCNHIFCKSCIRRCDTCPLCRNELN